MTQPKARSLKPAAPPSYPSAPPRLALTGVIYLKSGGITPTSTLSLANASAPSANPAKFKSNALTRHCSMQPSSYTAVRYGMNVSPAPSSTARSTAGIGLENAQMVELEELLSS
ncbi:hypothetical protein LPUS_01556 [Lasallia pustulata]|uniref:Uncharacterized protein n=1 Tax=Lasallia pustulata TaxID=136370 RepID=A0A1W5DDF9_9LECA|nr:hypothetical protein LPUS_01556 [Lasallia pustulata]